MAYRGNSGVVARCQSLSAIYFSAKSLTTKVQFFDNTQQKIGSHILQTENVESLFSGMTFKELLKSLLNLELVAYEPVVNRSIKVLTSPLMKYAIYRAPVLFIVKRTAHSHFCAGEDVAEATETLRRMWELGLRGIMDYGLEDATDNLRCDKNLVEFLRTIHESHQLPAGSVSFAKVKTTAICPIQLLERVSDLLRWRHKNNGFKLPWDVHVGLPVLAADSPTYHVQSVPEPLTGQEEQDWTLAQQRLWKLCDACGQVGLPLLVDAEYTSVQPAIDYLTYAAALEFNKGCHSMVYGTLQSYLTDAFSRLTLGLKWASEHQLSLGVKLVRGAYISREIAQAASLGASSPIHSSIHETHCCYDSCAALLLQHAASRQACVVLATHNMNSGRAAASKAEELGFSRSDPRLQFAQLMGMADVLSLSLAQAGFQVSKCVPFGPVSQVVPYLVRRAEENRGLLGNTLADRRCLRQELQRRLQLVGA